MNGVTGTAVLVNSVIAGGASGTIVDNNNGGGAIPTGRTSTRSSRSTSPGT